MKNLRKEHYRYEWDISFMRAEFKVFKAFKIGRYF